MSASRRDRDPFGDFDLRRSRAQSEHDAAEARRYLRRRRELLLCVLVSVLGVAVARSIPLVEHEQELCDCRTNLTEHRAAAGWKRSQGIVDVVIAGDGILAEPQAHHGRVVLATRCDSTREVRTQ